MVWKSWVWSGVLAASVAAAGQAPDPRPVLRILAYDSFMAEGGLGPAIVPEFERLCSCRLEVTPAGDAGQMLARARFDGQRGKASAQVVLGVDLDSLATDEHWIDRAWKPVAYKYLDRKLRESLPAGFIPFDEGVFALMVDRDALAREKLEPPRRLEDLLEPRYRRKLLLEDPRTSSPGMGFLRQVRAALGESGWEYWKRLRGQWLTLAPGWDAAYGLFLKGEAPLVWSYVTSQAYHREHGDREGRYQAVLLGDVQVSQIEGAAIVKDAVATPADRDRARAFVEYLLSEPVQRRIPSRNWMMPVRQGVAVPDSFASLPKPRRLERNRAALSPASLLARWSAAVEAR